MKNNLPGSWLLSLVGEVGGELLSLAFTVGIGAAVLFAGWLLGKVLGF